MSFNFYRDSFLRKFWLHVVLFSSFPFVNFWANNFFDDISYSTLIAFGIIIVSLFEGIYLILSRYKVMPKAAASFFVCVLVLFIFNYSLTRIDTYVKSSLLRILYITLLLLTTCFIYHKRYNIQQYYKYFIVFLIFLYIPPLYSISLSLFNSSNATFVSEDSSFENLKFTKTPNVYHFIIDGYANSFSLKKYNGYDNTVFIDQMKNIGFYNVKYSLSNANFTRVSVPMFFTMQYLHNESNNYLNTNFFTDFLKNNVVVNTFLNNGYQIFQYETVGHLPAWNHATFIPAQLEFDNQTFFNLVALTPFRKLANRICELFVHVEESELQYIKRILPSLYKNKKPFFFSAHTLSTHGPFTYDSKCKFIPPLGVNHEMKNFKNVFLDSTRCSSIELVEISKDILANDPTALIIIQSDHGSDVNVFFRQRGNTVKVSEKCERYSNLLLFHLPEKCQFLLNDHLTNINTFKVVFSCLSDQKLQFLPDEFYWLKEKRGHEILHLDPIEIDRQQCFDL